MISKLDTAPMLLHDTPANRQPQPGPSLFTGVGSVYPLEPLENGFQLVLRNALALVPDPKHHTAASLLGAELDAATTRREFDRIPEQVGECLHQSFPISSD